MEHSYPSHSSHSWLVYGKVIQINIRYNLRPKFCIVIEHFFSTWFSCRLGDLILSLLGQLKQHLLTQAKLKSFSPLKQITKFTDNNKSSIRWLEYKTREHALIRTIIIMWHKHTEQLSYIYIYLYIYYKTLRYNHGNSPTSNTIN